MYFNLQYKIEEEYDHLTGAEVWRKVGGRLRK
jgi:hypothetical protein